MLIGSFTVLDPLQTLVVGVSVLEQGYRIIIPNAAQENPWEAR